MRISDWSSDVCSSDLTVPDSTWVIVTSAPATGWPSAPVTWPPIPADVLCAKAGAAASAAISPSDSLESRRREWFMSVWPRYDCRSLRTRAQALLEYETGVSTNPTRARARPLGLTTDYHDRRNGRQPRTQ